MTTEPKLSLVERANAALDRSSRGIAFLDSQRGGGSVNLIRGDELNPEPIRWVWDGWLARGKLHILAGAPGTGKTTIAMAVAATVTLGGRWPDGSRCEPGNVLIWSGEDDPTDTLLPRLMAVGADRDRVYFVGGVSLLDGKEREFDPSRDIQPLLTKAETIGDIQLLIVDPVVNAVAGDSHKNGEVRRALQPVVELAKKLNAAALGISHFSKGSAGKDPVERVTGSVAFGALPRVVMAAAKSTDGDVEKRIFVRSKSNIGPDGGGYEYSLEQIELRDYPGVKASRVLWGNSLDGSARELLAVADAEDSPEEKSLIEQASGWLKDRLDEGAVECQAIFLEGAKLGFDRRLLQRARGRIGAEFRREGFAEKMKSTWRLPPFVTTDPICDSATSGANPVTNDTNGADGADGVVL